MSGYPGYNPSASTPGRYPPGPPMMNPPPPGNVNVNAPQFGNPYHQQPPPPAGNANGHHNTQATGGPPPPPGHGNPMAANNVNVNRNFAPPNTGANMNMNMNVNRGPPPPAGRQAFPVPSFQPPLKGPPPPGAPMQQLNTAMGGMSMNNGPPAPFHHNQQPPPHTTTGSSFPQPPNPMNLNNGAPPPPPGGNVPHNQLNPNAPQSNFYAVPPSQGQMNRFATGPTPNQQQPGFMPAETPIASNTNPDVIDFSITTPDTMLRLTNSKLPATNSLAAQSKCPMGGIIRPFANDTDIDVIHPGAAGIIRCKRCRTYINAFVSWIENGRRWRCNICTQLNEVPSAYFCHLDEKNRRRDVDQRPELSKSVIEWVAPSEYMVRPPQPPAYIFVMDVSVSAVRSGMLYAATNAIKRALDDLPGGERTKFALITFDTAVHYYALKPGSSNAQMMVVSDLKELFVPVPDDLFVSLKDSRAAVDNLLENLPTMFERNTASESCLGPALKAAFTICKSIGGKMCIFQSMMPSLGDGALKPRDNPRIMGTPDEVKLLRPDMNWYKDTAVEFNRNQISVDMFLFPFQSIDVAALSEFPKLTAGTLHTYVGFNLERDGPQLESTLYRRLVQPTAFEAVLRIRCTKGMRVSNFYGNFFIRGTDLLALPNCGEDSVFGFDLVHEEPSINDQFVTIQSALLYTSSDGERRIRVATQIVPVTTRVSELVAGIDTEALITLLSKQAIDVCIKSNIDNARARLQQTCVDIIRAAKEGDARRVSGYAVPPPNQQQPSSGQEEKETPKNIELLPLFTLALLKNAAFRGGTDVHPDERVSVHMTLCSLFVKDAVRYIHPRLFSVHDMEPNAGMPANINSNEDEDSERFAGRNKILLPANHGLTIDSLNSRGIYILDNGIDTSLWVGRAADPNTLNSLFGIESFEGVDMNQVKLNSSGNDLASRLDTILHALREETNGLPSLAPKVTIIREGDMQLESRLFWNMIEDRSQFHGGTYNYEEFVQFVNRSPGAPLPPGGSMPPNAGMPPGPSAMNPSMHHGPVPPPQQPMGVPPSPARGPPQPSQQSMGAPPSSAPRGPPPPAQQPMGVSPSPARPMPSAPMNQMRGPPPPPGGITAVRTPGGPPPPGAPIPRNVGSHSVPSRPPGPPSATPNTISNRAPPPQQTSNQPPAPSPRGPPMNSNMNPLPGRPSSTPGFSPPPGPPNAPPMGSRAPQPPMGSQMGVEQRQNTYGAAPPPPVNQMGRMPPPPPPGSHRHY